MEELYSTSSTSHSEPRTSSLSWDHYLRHQHIINTLNKPKIKKHLKKLFSSKIGEIFEYGRLCALYNYELPGIGEKERFSMAIYEPGQPLRNTGEIHPEDFPNSLFLLETFFIQGIEIPKEDSEKAEGSEMIYLRCMKKYPSDFLSWNPLEHPKKDRIELYKYFVASTISGLEALHRHNIVHRDIKPGNILIDPLKKLALLIDFEFCNYFDDSLSEKEIPGTAEYLLKPDGSFLKSHPKQNDRFALGLTLAIKFPLEINSALHLRKRLCDSIENKNNEGKPSALSDYLSKTSDSFFTPRDEELSKCLDDIESISPEIGNALKALFNPEIPLTQILEFEIFQEALAHFEALEYRIAQRDQFYLSYDEILRNTTQEPYQRSTILAVALAMYEQYSDENFLPTQEENDLKHFAKKTCKKFPKDTPITKFLKNALAPTPENSSYEENSHCFFYSSDPSSDNHPTNSITISPDPSPRDDETEMDPLEFYG